MASIPIVRNGANGSARRHMPTRTIGGIVRNDERMFQSLIITRSALFGRLVDFKHDIDVECGYPPELTPEQYRYLYDREGIANRVVSLEPDESWAVDPEVYEEEGDETTEWEDRWQQILEETNLLSYCHRADELSRIAFYGLLFYGTDDGNDMAEPLPGIDDDGNETGEAIKDLNVTYLRAFDQSLVRIQNYEHNPLSPRYGQPTYYTIRFMDLSSGSPDAAITGGNYLRRVHWSRCIHLASDRKSSEVFGVPAQRPSLNRILDLRKLYGGSAEMFWKGAFPGTAFEVDPDFASEAEFGEDERRGIREEYEEYSAGLRRYLTLLGVQAKQLAPQVAEPHRHIMEHLRAISVQKKCPLRIFLGSEEAKLASSTDKRTWNERMRKRQLHYNTPYILRPIIKRFQYVGILPTPKKSLKYVWPDLNKPTDQDKANLAITRTQAIVQYVSTGSYIMISPKKFFTVILGMTRDEAEEIMDDNEFFENGKLKAGAAQIAQEAAAGVQQSKEVDTGIKQAKGGDQI